MKKLIIGFALVCFVAFGTFGVQNAVASTDNIEIVTLNLDDDPDKAKNADGKDKKNKKSTKECKDSKENCKSSCKDSKAKCNTGTKCCSSKSSSKSPDKKGDEDKK